jgi:hypothetical protein
MSVKKYSSSVCGWYETFKSLVDSGAFPSVIHRALLYGLPGTGKSTIGLLLFGEDTERVTLHPELLPDDLIGSMVLRGDGKGGTETVWCDGPAIRAMRAGKCLIMDEIDKQSPECASINLAICDDKPRVLLPTGEVVVPAPGFSIIATSNAEPTALPDALLSRFSGGCILQCNTPAPGIVDGMPKAFGTLLNNSYKDMAASGVSGTRVYYSPLACRPLRAALALANTIGQEKAFALTFGPKEGPNILASAATMKV